MAYTGSTSGYQAAAQANDTAISFALETVYGIVAKGNYQRTRFTSENFKPNDSTQRPEEVNADIESAQEVLTQSPVSGTLSGALSSGTYDDFFAAVLGAEWTSNKVQNGPIVKTWTINEKLNAAWLVRPGSYCTQAQLTFTQGSYAQVAFDFSCRSQGKSVTDPATGYTDAPSGRVIDTVGNFSGVTIFGQTPAGSIREIQIRLARDGAGSDYGMGDVAACGIRPGQLLATGQIQMFFKTWDQYDQYVSQTQGPIAVSVKDASGNAYTFTFLNAVLRNPVINVGGKNTSVMATFDISGNPQAGGGTFSITRTPVAPAPTQNPGQ